MRRTVTVDLEELNSLLEQAINHALHHGHVFHKAGMIGPVAVARVNHGLAAAGRIRVEGEATA